MSFLNNIKKVMGFGPDTPEDWQQDDATPVADTEQPTPRRLVQPAASLDFEPAMEQAIFAKVVEVFDASMPEFMQKSVDPQRQRQYLYDALDESIKQYLASLRAASDAACQSMWESDKAQMRQQMESLQKRASELEARRGEIADKQLSSERQRRALNERIRDLEEQLMTVEAEKEQYQLEAQSLLNKVKVATVHEGDYQALQEEVSRLRSGKGIDPEAEKQAREQAQAMQQRIDELTAQVAAFDQERTKMHDSAEAAKIKMQMSDQMLSDLHAKVAEKDTAIADLQAKLQAKDEELARAAEATVDTVTREELDELLSQIDLFEDVKAKMNERIDTLRDKLNASKTEIEGLQQAIKDAQTDKARQERKAREEADAIKAAHAKELKALKKRHADEIEALKAKVDISVEPQAPYDDGAADDNEFDDLLSGEDWLVATPAKDTSMRSQVDDLDFGYQAPPKKQKHPENKQQMSLFD